MLSDVDFFLMSGTISFSLFKNACLCEEYFVQLKRQRFSLSTSLNLYNGHNLFSLGTW